MQFIDSHIHLQDYKANNAPHFVANMKSLGLEALICPSVNENDWDRVIRNSYQNSLLIIPALGMHPWYLNNATEKWKEDLERKLKENPKALIGECGFDRLKNANHLQQKEAFMFQTDLSIKLNRSLLIHAVKADVWLEEFWLKLKQTKFVIHSFSGSLELMQKAVSVGGYISFSPSIYKRSNCFALFKNVPIERLLVESDGPYQGEPNDIPELISSIADIKQQSPETLNQQIKQNFWRFINVK